MGKYKKLFFFQEKYLRLLAVSKKFHHLVIKIQP